ncbi:MAG: 30S ribosomal protein S4e [Candidatus Odinarchaeum yellowstonii]|uniref:Small ribosomal subunit protein eS4 n=1 Tax=Odinarchaeota yellowstonii (strain LCB_4) TaxID=1841599 RepID=A0AAF0IAR1_ODILC|nr:MAG: 30S ribosomal protein S4e [Candidatus Odinarchaeum yellowstonii]
MGKLGPTLHLKRLNAPSLWRIPRKTVKFAIKTTPGPHKKGLYLPLGMIIRDMLGYAKTLKEVKYILTSRMVLVNGKPRVNYRFPVGLMDVIEIPKTKEIYRVLVNTKGFILHPISKKEAASRLCMIMNKTTVKGGHIQLNLSDGSNILIKVKDPKKPVEDKYQTKDALLISNADNKIKDHVPLKEGVYILIFDGKNMGYTGVVKNIERRFGPFASVVTISTEKHGEIKTALEYVFPIGVEKPLISLPEVAVNE